jgi:hypothetical protein
MANKPVVNIDDIALTERAHGERFQVKLARVGPLVGLNKLGCSLHVVPAGKRAWPRHAHHEADELFYSRARASIAMERILFRSAQGMCSARRPERSPIRS